MKAKKPFKLARPFFQKLLSDKSIRIYFEEESIKTKIAHAVRHARLKANLTQLQLAKSIGTSQSVIARLEGGSDKRVPSIPLLAKIAAACGAHFELEFNFKKAA